MKKKYLKPEIQVIKIERQVMLAGSVKASCSDNSSIEDGGDTSTGGIYSID